MSYSKPLYTQSYIGGNGNTGTTGPTGAQGPISNAGGLNLYFNASEPSSFPNKKLLTANLLIEPTPITVNIPANSINDTSNWFAGTPITNVTAIPPGPFNIFIYASSTAACYIEAKGYIVTISDGSLNQIFDVSTNTINNTNITLYTIY